MQPKRGTLLILGIFLLALVAAGLGIWHAQHETERTRGLWGPAAGTIARGERIEVLRLKPADGRGDLVALGEALAIVDRRDVSRVPEFGDVRKALTLNRSFDWLSPDELSNCRATWTHALRFARGTETATVVLSFPCPRATLAGSTEQVGIKSLAPRLKPLVDAPWAQ